MQSIYQIVVTATAEPVFTGSWAQCYEKINGTHDKTAAEREALRDQWKDHDTIKLWDADDYSNSDTVRTYISDAIEYVENNHFIDSDTGEDEANWIDGRRSELIHEASNEVISVYTGVILEAAMEDLSLATTRSELSDGNENATAFDLITTNIYEIIYNAVHEYYAVKDQIK